MPLPDDQLDLLQTARDALHQWQAAAQALGVTLQQVVMEFPPVEQSNQVRFTWNLVDKFDIAT